MGQFNTTNKDYILDGFEKYLEKNQHWVDPFAGNGDLLEWIKNQDETALIEGYDVDKTKKWTIRDTLFDPPDYKNKWIIANPPYLAMNKSKNKFLFDKHNQDDLYKIAIKTICESESCGGIFIVPLNFLSSKQAKKTRNIFYEKFKIEKCKVFEEQVFDDTDYTVCAFYYTRRKQKREIDNIEIEFLPSKENANFTISKSNGWILGEEFYIWLEGTKTKGVERWTVYNAFGGKNDLRDEKGILINDIPKTQNQEFLIRFIYFIEINKSIIPKYIDVSPDNIDDETSLSKKADDLFREKYPNLQWTKKLSTSRQYYKPEVEKNIIWAEAIDTGTNDGKIGLKDIRPLTKSVGHKPIVVGLPSSRNKAHIKFDDPPSIENQEKIINYVNDKLLFFRNKYHSVFLTAFRNSSNEYSRKRINFEIIYKMINKARKEIGC